MTEPSVGPGLEIGSDVGSTIEIDQSTGLIQRPMPASYPFGPRSFAALLESEHVDDRDRTALTDGARSWTYDELAAAVRDAAGRLVERGITSGDRVVWSSPNHAELVVAFLAVQRLGAVWVGLHHKLPVEPSRMLAERVQPQLTVDGLDQARTIVDLTGNGSRADDTRTTAATDPHRPAAIAFTSGTTGTPKAVVHTQHSMLAPGLVSVRTSPPLEGERIGTPLEHTILNVLLLGPISALLRNSTSVIVDRTFADGFADDVRTKGVTSTFVVPTMLHDLVASETVADDSFAAVRSIVSGGAGASPDLRRRFADRFGVRPQLSYGLTEAPTGIVRESLDEPIGESRSLALPHLRVVEVEGELCVHAAADGEWANCWTGTLGYWRDPDATEQLFRGGVMHTGDAGTVDAEGSVQVTGRVSDMIVRGGANIDPREVEAALLGLDEISEAAVLGVPDGRLGQRVGALIVLTDDVDTEPDLSALLATSHIRPDATRVVDRLPRNTMGKIDQSTAVSLLADATNPIDTPPAQLSSDDG